MTMLGSFHSGWKDPGLVVWNPCGQVDIVTWAGRSYPGVSLPGLEFQTHEWVWNAVPPWERSITNPVYTSVGVCIAIPGWWQLRKALTEQVCIHGQAGCHPHGRIVGICLKTKLTMRKHRSNVMGPGLRTIHAVWDMWHGGRAVQVGWQSPLGLCLVQNEVWALESTEKHTGSG